MIPPAMAAAQHALPVDAVMDSQRVSTDGLTETDAQTRLDQVGRNQLRQAKPVRASEILFNQIKSVIVLLLLAASILSFAVGDALEGAAIGAAIGLTILLGFFTELRAVRSMEALRKLGAVRARVRRDGVDREVNAEELVPGDLILFEGGERITADVRIIEASKLQADESALTGESVPVGKHIEPLPEKTPLADRKNMLYKGATVTRGAGAGIVVGTGMDTELGRIAALVEQAEDEQTPLERRLAVLGSRLLWVCLAIAAVTSAVGILSGRSTMLMIETGIALAVAAIPEGLPVVATIALARGMWRLAGRHALIKRLSAVETLGATSVIVTDKTGTLTENRMSVVALTATGEARRVALEVAALCNNASLAGDQPTGDPLEVALLQASAAEGIERTQLLAALPEVREEAFDPAVKMMATVHKAEAGLRVAVKGAPETVLAACVARWTEAGAKPLSDDDRAQLLEQGEAMASSGLRMLALADKAAATVDTDVYAGLTFVALVALADPPRKEVAGPLASCRRAGVRVIMATGDQPATAFNIAKEVGLVEGEPTGVVHGDDLGPASSWTEQRKQQLLAASVFARVTPEQKLDIIDLHQRNGAVVAMTGDGVNDAPALRKAEIGIAMGQRGTDVAREAAEMVLKDDSFDSIVVAVEQGRAIFENIRRFVIYLLSCNVSELLIVTIAVLFGAPLPLLPLQILFLNLVTDVFPALALGFGTGDPRAMDRPPRDARESIVTRRHWMIIVGYAALLTAAVLGAMALAHYAGATAAQTTSVSFLTLGFAQLWHVFNMRGRGTDAMRNDIVRNPWIWGAVAMCVVLMAVAAFFGPLASVLRVESLNATLWLIIIVTSLAPWLLGQLALGHTRATRSES